MVKVLMPKGSDTMTEGKVLKWLKKEGDQVSTGDAVVEIETDKVDMEVEAMGGGVLRKILVQCREGGSGGELLALIAKPDEDISALLKGEGAAATPAPAPAPSSHPPAIGSPAPACAAPSARPAPASHSATAAQGRR